MKGWLAALGGAFVALAVGGALRAGPYFMAPAAVPRASEAVVALGGERRLRAAKAAELYRRGLAERVVLINPLRGNPVIERPDQLGVRDEALEILDGPCGTWTEARAIRHMAVERHWQRVLVVTDPPHLRRTAWALARAFDGESDRYLLVATEPDWWNTRNWWRNARARQYVMDEQLKLLAYRLHYEWLGALGLGLKALEEDCN